MRTERGTKNGKKLYGIGGDPELPILKHTAPERGGWDFLSEKARLEQEALPLIS